jgi:hypothetical protein
MNTNELWVSLIVILAMTPLIWLIRRNRKDAEPFTDDE